MARPKSQRGAAAVRALRERQRAEAELLTAWVDADSELLAAEERLDAAVQERDKRLAELAHALGPAAASDLTGQPAADVRRARAAYPASGDDEPAARPADNQPVDGQAVDGQAVDGQPASGEPEERNAEPPLVAASTAEE